MHKILAFFVFFVLILGSCATPIKKFYANPDKFQGKKVCIKGTVVSSLEFKDLCNFTIKDRTGNIVVVTQNLLPLKNDKIRVKGVFEKNFQYKEQKMLIIKEKRMKGRKLLVVRNKVEKL